MIRRESITCHISTQIDEPSGVGVARRNALVLASEARFAETETGKVGIIVTELATNLVKHAGGGEMLVRIMERHGTPGVEIIALDKGQGIPDLQRSLEDGFSTSGTQGTGLGAIRRQADFFDVYTLPNVGTCVLAHVWSKSQQAISQTPLEFGVVCRAVAGEEVCGDSWGLEQKDSTAVIMVADGLGHGPLAADASEAAVRVLYETSSQNAAHILDRTHGVLRSTRGAAVAVAEVSNHDQIIRYAGIGNISATIIANDATRSLVSHNGTVGHQIRKAHEFQYPWPLDATLIMASDGLQSHWTLDKYPGLLRRHPSLIAAVLYRDFSRGRDDITVFVARASSRHSQ